MYNTPYPVLVPIPLPFPVPVFIPTTRNSQKGIMKQIKKIQNKVKTQIKFVVGMELEKKELSTNMMESGMKQIGFSNTIFTTWLFWFCSYFCHF